ncbi:DUF2442 domain-containing protein [Thiomicrorhabdus aquaedulcis]|uniref:DUF2442 domain-containing protein n=1 Tax=Thiomicrorhabdus aquaedulcis TaxID=2211106 RepID=UPI000FDB1B08|nr:DUF2442 domain-containing protein [Thiomicrorhabdus aquaedulcis]
MNGLAGKAVHVDDQFLHVDLIDGRRISTPLSWYPTLEKASIAQIKTYTLICDATGIEWESLDYHLSIEAMLNINLDNKAA